MGWFGRVAYPPSRPNVRNTRSICGSDGLEDGEEVLPDHVGVAIEGGFGALLAEDFDEVEEVDAGVHGDLVWGRASGSLEMYKHICIERWVQHRIDVEYL